MIQAEKLRMSNRKTKTPYGFSDGSPLPTPVMTGTVLTKNQIALSKNGVSSGKAKKFLNHRTDKK
jgi:hypothetical protein